ncbi:hypothetical protein ES703_05556 [subsurface metagenome]
MQQGIPDYHFRLRVPPGGPPLGQTFGKPQRRVAVVPGTGLLGFGVNLSVHEYVHQLVADDFAKVVHGAVVGQHHPPFHEFEKAAHPFRYQVRDGVGLLEMKVVAVDHQGHPSGQGVVELLLQFTVGFLRPEGRGPGQGLLNRVIEYLEVGGNKYLPVELLVLDLVAAEIELAMKGAQQKQGYPYNPADPEEVLPEGSLH